MFTLHCLSSFLRRVRKTDGLRLSEEYSILFGETSAFDGRHVDQVLLELASELRQRQDLDMQKTLTLSLEAGEEDIKSKKKSCCGK